MADSHRSAECTAVPVMDQFGKDGIVGDCSRDAASRRLYDAVAAGTAQIKVDNALGSGFLVRNGDEVVTNAHVVEGSKHIRVVTADGEFPAEIERLDDINDLALLKIIGPKPVKARALELGQSDNLSKADPLFAVGHPLGRENIWVSPGTYDAKAPLWAATLDHFEDREAYARAITSLGNMMGASTQSKDLSLKADATNFLDSPRVEMNIHTEHGSSGSPVVDLAGKVVAVDDALLPSVTLSTGTDKSEKTEKAALLRSAAIPVEKVKELLSGADPKFEFVYKTEQSLNNSPKVLAMSQFAEKHSLPVQWAFSPWAEPRRYLAEVKRKNGENRQPLAWNGWDKP